MKILEVGCGTGTTALTHAPKVGYITATDISSNMVTIAKAKAVDQGIDNVEFIQKSVDDLNYPDQSFDMVMAHSFLHLIRSPEKIMTKLVQMISPGGYFISSTVCLNEQYWLIAVGLPVGSFFGFVPFVNRLAVSDVEAMHRQSKLKIIHQWLQNGRTLFLIAQKAKES